MGRRLTVRSGAGASIHATRRVEPFEHRPTATTEFVLGTDAVSAVDVGVGRRFNAGVSRVAAAGAAVQGLVWCGVVTAGPGANGGRRRRAGFGDLHDRCSSSYLGYPLLISEYSVVVSTPAGRRIGRVPSVKQARLLIRGYRRVLREETGSRVVRVVADLGETGSGPMTMWTGLKETC
jgi:hypothetical protein